MKTRFLTAVVFVLVLMLVLCNHLPANAAALEVQYKFDGSYDPGKRGGDPGFTVDRFGNEDSALQLDGSNAYVFAGDTGLGPPTMTVTAWFRADSFGSGYSWPAIVKKSDNTQTNGFSLEIGKVYEGTPVVSFVAYLDDGQGWGNASWSETLNVDTWYFVAGRYDGSSFDLFAGPYDGQLTHVPGLSRSGNIIPSVNDLNIGRDPSNPGSARSFNGAIDDVRIYGGALSQAEIEAIYNVPEPSTLILAVGAFGLATYGWRGRKRSSR